GAIDRRASHRAPFEGVAVPAPVVREIVAAGGAPGVEARPLRPGREIAVVTRLLHFAAESFQRDSGYQRELSLWTIRDEHAHRHGVGIPGRARTRSRSPGSPDRPTAFRRCGVTSLRRAGCRLR